MAWRNAQVVDGTIRTSGGRALRCWLYRRSDLRDADLHRHSERGVEGSHEAAGDRGTLEYVLRDRQRDQIGAPDTAIGRVKGDPARARNEDFGPGVGRAGADRARRWGIKVPV